MERLKEIMKEWSGEIEGEAKRSKPAPEKVIGLAFQNFEREIESMLEKIGVMTSVLKDEVEKETANRKRIAGVAGGDETLVPCLWESRRLRRLEDIGEKMKQLRDALKGVAEYRKVVEGVEGEFAGLARRANCLFRGEELDERRYTFDDGETEGSDSD